MLQNKIYDVIIIGASAEGLILCDFLKNKTPELGIALISKSFANLSKKQDLSGIDVITGEAVVSSYNHGLIGFTLKDKISIFGKAAVIATGSKPAKSTFKSNSIFYKAADAPIAKNKAAVVYGDSSEAVEYALTTAKKYKYVYLCTPTIALNGSKRNLNKLDNTANIVTLPNCNITGIKNDKAGNLTEITLDTYDTIRCAALILSLGRAPDVSGISKKMIEVDAQGYAITKEFNETTKIPGIYAIGACAKHNTKQSISIVGNKIIERK